MGADLFTGSSEVAPVADPARRFPRPGREADVLMTGVGGALSRRQIFDYLTDAAAEHWQHQLPWKHYTRLLAAGDWVFKTNGWYCSPELSAVRQRIRSWKARSREIGIWHPARSWFILHEGERFWPCTVTPRLVTLQELARQTAEARGAVALLAFDVRRYLLFFRILFTFGLVLDVKRANFGVQPGGRSLYYIDDELYRFYGWQDLFHWHLRLQR